MRYYAYNLHTPDANPRTLFQVLAPANQRITIYGGEFGLGGADPSTVPVLFDWVLQTTAGTASALTPQYQDRGIAETKLATLQKDFTAEPTLSTVTDAAGDIYIYFTIHQQGTYLWRPPFPIVVGGGERVGLRYRSATFVAVTFTLFIEE